MPKSEKPSMLNHIFPSNSTKKTVIKAAIIAKIHAAKCENMGQSGSQNQREFSGGIR
jgi:hypothetical protein